MEQTDILLRFGNQMLGELDAEALKESYVELARLLNEIEMDSREKTIAIERLEESFMWAKKGCNV